MGEQKFYYIYYYKKFENFKRVNTMKSYKYY